MSWQAAAVNQDFSSVPTTGVGSPAQPPGVVVDVLVSHLMPHFSATHRQAIVTAAAQSTTGSTSAPSSILHANHHMNINNNHPVTTIDFRAWRGSRALVQVAQDGSIPLVLSGHVHWGRGAVYLPHDHHHHHDGTWFINASNTKPGCSREAQQDSSRHKFQVTPPVIVDFDVQRRQVVSLSCPPHDDDDS